MLQPKLPNYSHREWTEADFPTQLKMVCRSWAKDGYGAPFGVYGFYLVKMIVFIGGWFFFCLQNPSFSADLEMTTWWADPQALTKAILWAMLFEVLGLGCGSGPLTARYLPPFGGFLYFLRPGTLKLPLFPRAPIVGNSTRNFIDIGVYAGLILILLQALLSTAVQSNHLVLSIVLVIALGILDKTLFLALRSEHYLSVLICFLFVGDSIAGAKMVWIFLWLGAGISKLNHHFPSVVGVMLSNAPWSRFGPLRKWMYRSYPNDLNPSKFAHISAAMGTILELGIPLVFIFASGGLSTTVGIVLMLCLHLFIMSTVPMGVPLEWNIVMIYGACVLFGSHVSIMPYDISSHWLWCWLLTFHIGSIVLGNLYPHRISFLLSHRYYAGNWAYSVWLFKADCAEILEEKLTMSTLLPTKQLSAFYSPQTVDFLLSKVIAFRMMHLLGRALRTLIPLSVKDVSEYRWFDGELIAGLCLGWNFGDGHLSGAQLLNSVQDKCEFKEGDLRCIFVESQPIHSSHAQWSIVDAATGVVKSGTISIDTLRSGQPWELVSSTNSARSAPQEHDSEGLEKHLDPNRTNGED